MGHRYLLAHLCIPCYPPSSRYQICWDWLQPEMKSNEEELIKKEMLHGDTICSIPENSLGQQSGFHGHYFTGL